MFRTDWEGMIEASTFNSFNILNAIAGAMLAQIKTPPLKPFILPGQTMVYTTQ